MLEPTKAFLVFMLPPDQKNIFFNFLTDSSGRVSWLLSDPSPILLHESHALPHGRATEQAKPRVSSPRVSKGCGSGAMTYETLTGLWVVPPSRRQPKNGEAQEQQDQSSLRFPPFSCWLAHPLTSDSQWRSELSLHFCFFARTFSADWEKALL
jgi:hypothetical protein